MAGATLTVNDLVLPLVTAIAGYVVGILQSVAADRRDRSRARNRLLYLLFQVRREVRVSNPREFLPLVSRAVTKHVAVAELPGDFPDDTVLTSLLSAMLQALTGERLTQLTESYESAVQTLVSTDPILALRLNGAHISRLDGAIKAYYKRVQEEPELAADPHAARVFATMEAHALELALKEALDQLAADIRNLARSYLPFKRRRLLRLLDAQTAVLSEQELDAQLGPVLDEMVNRVKSMMMTSPITQEQQSAR